MTGEPERGGRSDNGHGRKPIFPGVRTDERENLRPVNVARIEEVKHAKHASRHRLALSRRCCSSLPGKKAMTPKRHTFLGSD
jgi:hypothetical protein